MSQRLQFFYFIFFNFQIVIYQFSPSELVRVEGLSGLAGKCVYLACCSSREDGFHHDSSASTSNDAKTKSFPIIGQLYHLYMTILR